MRIYIEIEDVWTMNRGCVDGRMDGGKTNGGWMCGEWFCRGWTKDGQRIDVNMEDGWVESMD